MSVEGEGGPAARARRVEGVPVSLLAAFLLLRCVQEIGLALALRDAPAAGVLSVPPLAFWGPVCVVTSTLAVVALVSALRRGPAQRVRAFYVFGFLAIAVDLFLIPSSRLPPIVTADLVAQSALEEVRAQLLLADPARLPVEAEALSEVLERGPAPPYVEAGRRLRRWRVVVQSECEGPVLEAGGHPVGTLFYCVGADRRRGYLTWVGTGGREVGPPVLASGPKGPLVVELAAMDERVLDRLSGAATN